jgi:hypothetical protein
LITSLCRSLCRELVDFACACIAGVRGTGGAPIRWGLFPLIGIIALTANAQVIDQIELQPDSNGEKEVVLKFFSDVVLTRFSPSREAQTIRVYFTLVEQAGPVASLPREIRTGPLITGIPRFTVSFPEQDGSLSIAFPSPVKFNVRQVRGSRTISVFVKVAGGGADQGQQGGGRTEVSASKTEAAMPIVTYVPPAPRTFEPKVVPGFPDIATSDQPVSPPATSASSATTATQGPPADRVAVSATGTPSPTPTAATQAVAPASTPSVAVAPSSLESSTSPRASSAPPVTAAPSEPLVLPEPTDVFPPVPLSEVEGVSKDLLEKAKQSLAANDPSAAIRDLNHLLSLPTSASTREAQELMGIAWEKKNEIAKAKGEYELFLKLYPVGPDADRVRERLAKLPVVIEQTSPAVAGAPQGQTEQPSWIITGGLSQYLYRGNSHIEILTPPPPGLLTFNQQTLSLTDQNSLVTNVDVMALHRSQGTNTRIVFRDSYNKNYLSSSLGSQQRISAAYVEQNDQAMGLQYRVGRQSGTFGMVGMFDGAYGSYQFMPGYRLSALAGQMAQFGTTLYNQNYVGAGIEKQPTFESVGGTLYFLQNRADGYMNREAVGLELRYFDAYKSGFSMVDYDLLFKDINLIMVQGNLRLDNGTSFFALTDHRRSPMLQLTSVFPAAASPADFTPAVNVTQALLNTGISLSDLRKWAVDSTATSHMTSFGVSYPLTQQWQVGADFGFSSVSAIPGVGSIPAQPDSGVSRTSNFQVIGSGVLSATDTMVANVTLIDAPTYTGRNLNLNVGNSWFDYKLRVDLGWREYQQRDRGSSATLTRASPTLRVSYRAFKDVSIEAETGLEKSHQIDASGNTTDSLRKYLYTGYRWSWF